MCHWAHVRLQIINPNDVVQEYYTSDMRAGQGVVEQNAQKILAEL